MSEILQDTNLTEQETLYRAKWTQSTRDTHKASGGYFAGPGTSFPLKDCSDVGDAWGLAGHADNPDQIRSNVKSWASKNNCTGSLPDTAKDDSKSDRAAQPTPTGINDPEALHDPFLGKHSHGHPHAIDGYDHEHEHEHHNDNNHDHAHMHAHRTAQPDVQRSTVPEHVALYAPITRIDKSKWEVDCVATSEELDSFGTIFSYEGSKKAFQQWMERTANVREMHDKIAAGKGIIVRFDDQNKKIHLRTRISRGAPNTWLKVEDGVLDGYSVGATKPVWGTVERDGKKYPYLLNYELAEVSLVDNASNPDAQGLVICRAEGLTELVDITDPEPEQTLPPSESSSSSLTVPVERAGARLSAESCRALHDMRDKAMSLCGCEECQGMQGGTGDGDNDADDRMAQSRALEELITRLLAPVIQRSNHILARVAGQPDYPDLSPELIRSAVAAEVEPIRSNISGLAHLLNNLIAQVDASSLSEVRADLSAVKETVERIAAQPAPGGPLLNGGYTVDKHLANDPRQFAQVTPDQTAVRAVLDRLQASGALNTVEAQTAAASLLIQPMPGRRG